MMGYRKVLLSMSVLFLVLVGVSACGKAGNAEEEVLITGFLEKYYAQLAYSQEEQEAINQELEGLQTKIGLDVEIDKEFPGELKPNGFFYFFEDTLSPQLHENMFANRKLPNWKMIEMGLDKSEIRDLKLEKKDNIIHTSFTIECYQQDNLIEAKIVEVDFILKKSGDKIYIDSIDGDLGWDKQEPLELPINTEEEEIKDKDVKEISIEERKRVDLYIGVMKGAFLKENGGASFIAVDLDKLEGLSDDAKMVVLEGLVSLSPNVYNFKDVKDDDTKFKLDGNGRSIRSIDGTFLWIELEEYSEEKAKITGVSWFGSLGAVFPTYEATFKNGVWQLELISMAIS